MEAGRQEYEAWLRHKGITLRNAEDNYGNPNQSEKYVLIRIEHFAIFGKTLFHYIF